MSDDVSRVDGSAGLRGRRRRRHPSDLVDGGVPTRQASYAVAGRSSGEVPFDPAEQPTLVGAVRRAAAGDVPARSVRVEWGWSVPGGGPVAVRGESAAWDLAHRYEGSRVWRRLVGPWSEVSDGG